MIDTSLEDEIARCRELSECKHCACTMQGHDLYRVLARMIRQFTDRHFHGYSV